MSDVLARRLTAQLLAGRPARDPAAVAERILAVQGQDPRGVRLAIRARTRGLTAADVDHALDDASLVITWLNRGTLHLVRREDYGWLHALTRQPLLPGRRLAQEGVSPAAAERAVAAIESALADEGPLTRAQLAEHVARANASSRPAAVMHILFLASSRGLVVRGPLVGKQQAIALVRDWLGEQPRVDRDRALAELGRRYLAGHGPADDRDLAKWSGLPLREARAALRAVASETRERDGLVWLKGRSRAVELPPPRLLGSFEPMLLGWTSRVPFLGDDHLKVAINGLFRPFALVRGRGVATWSLRDGRVELAPFRRLAAADRVALEADARDVVRFLGR